MYHKSFNSIALLRQYHQIKRRLIDMSVESVGEKYRCEICGNEVTVTKVGGGTLVCCGQDMEVIK